MNIYYTTNAERDLVRLPVSKAEEFDKVIKLSALLHGDTLCIADLAYSDGTVFVKPRDERASRFYAESIIKDGSTAEESLYWALNEEVDLPGLRTMLINLRAGWSITLAVNAPDFP